MIFSSDTDSSTARQEGRRRTRVTVMAIMAMACTVAALLERRTLLYLSQSHAEVTQHSQWIFSLQILCMCDQVNAEVNVHLHVLCAAAFVWANMHVRYLIHSANVYSTYL